MLIFLSLLYLGAGWCRSEAASTNDDFGSRERITNLPWLNLQTLDHLTINEAERAIPGQVNGKPWWETPPDAGPIGVGWYEFQAPKSGAFYLGSRTLRAALFRGTNIGSLELVGATPPGGLRREVPGSVGERLNPGILSFQAVAGDIYQIGVLDASTETLPESVIVDEVATNDVFTGAIPISELPYFTKGTTRGTGYERGEAMPPQTNGFLTGSIWYRWRATESGDFLLAYTGPDVAGVAVFEGDTLAGLKHVEVDQTSLSFSELRHAHFQAQAGTNYSFVLHGAVDMSLIVQQARSCPGCVTTYQFPDGKFELSLSKVATNTVLKSAVRLSGSDLRIPIGMPIAAGLNEPATLWWEWVSSADGVASLSIQLPDRLPDDSAYGTLEVHPAGASNVPPVWNPFGFPPGHDSKVRFFAEKGRSYLLRTLTWVTRPDRFPGFPIPIQRSIPGASLRLELLEPPALKVPEGFGGGTWAQTGPQVWRDVDEPEVRGGKAWRVAITNLDATALRTTFTGPGVLKFKTRFTGTLVIDGWLRRYPSGVSIGGPNLYVRGEPALDIRLRRGDSRWMDVEIPIPAGLHTVCFDVASGWNAAPYGVGEYSIASLEWLPGAVAKPILTISRDPAAANREEILQLETWPGIAIQLEAAGLIFNSNELRWIPLYPRLQSPRGIQPGEFVDSGTNVFRYRMSGPDPGSLFRIR